MIESIYEAVKILEVGEKTNLIEIDRKYKKLLFKWHPDHCKDNTEACRAMTEQIIEAYRLLMDYCYNYSFSFKKEDLENNKESNPDEFWRKKFGNDPLSGCPK